MSIGDLLGVSVLADANGASRFATTFLVGALLMRFSGPRGGRLMYWGVAWIALGVQVAGSTLVAATMFRHESLGFQLGALLASVGTFGYLAGLILGVHDLPEQAPLVASHRDGLFLSVAILTALTVIGFRLSAEPTAFSDALRYHLPLISRASVCALVAHRLMRHGPRFATGRWLVAVSLILQASLSLNQSALLIVRAEIPPASSLASVVLSGLMGLGMIACLLDDEHQETVRASAEARRASASDALTGLPTQASFAAEAARRLELIALAPAGPGIGIIFVALKRLGNINHSLGHAVGDRVLRAVADRLRASLRDGDVVGRVGGDEFAVLVGCVSRPADAISVAHKLEETIRRPIELDERELSITASMGVSVYPDDAADAEALLDRACTAAHRSKDAVGRRVGVYAEGMNAGARERLSLEHDLRRAIERDELVLHFQPLFRLACGSLRGFEALLRWSHPRFGLIGAEVIISLAESTGLIHVIGEWALLTACTKAEGMRGPGRENLLLCVNVSAHQLMTGDLADQVRSALEQSGLPASSLEIEITETAAIDSIQTAREHLLQLKEMGVSIAIDDFGTGYSSLAYLRSLPVDTIKIDRSFIRGVAVDLSDGALVTTIIALAQGRALRVVAEGVETEEQLRFLVNRGCDYAQGYLLSHPLPAEAFESHHGLFPWRGLGERWSDG
jgi:diguanylate cyclase (GGDEF)-like protein